MRLTKQGVRDLNPLGYTNPSKPPLEPMKLHEQKGCHWTEYRHWKRCVCARALKGGE